MDPVSILTLVTFCVSTSASLYNTLDGFKSRKQDVRNLKIEVGNLNIVLQALAKNITETTANFENMKLVLEKCQLACAEFETTVLDNAKRSGNRIEDFKAWAKLQFAGGDINNFRKLIVSYQATITIALADSNLRTTTVTKDLLEQYTEIVQNTTADLEEQITELSDRLNTLRSQQLQTPPAEPSQQRINEEVVAEETLGQKAGLEQCLFVCHQLLHTIESARASIGDQQVDGTKTATQQKGVGYADHLAPRLTGNALQICSQNLHMVTQHLRDLRGLGNVQEKLVEGQVMQQLDIVRECLNIIEQGQEQRVNVYTNIKTGDGSFQTVVSTVGDLIKADGLTIGAGAYNIMGQMSNESLQSIAQKVQINVSEPTPVPEGGPTFEKRHGFGHTMQPKMFSK